MKSCKKGYYYCNTDKKCKPIPEGSVLRDDGFLMKETLDKKDKPFVKHLVKKLRSGSKTHAKQADDLEKAMNEGKHGDHEPEMIRNQLKTAGRASKRIVKHSRKKDNFKAWVQSKITKASDYLDTAADYLDSKEVNEEGLRAWFGKSSGTTKSGRKVKGWVQVGGKYDGKPCARQPGQKTTPKCTSSSKRASMSDKERDSAARRKRAADPGQPQKSGAAAPTMVSTDPKKKMKESYGGKGVSRKARLQSIHPPTAQAAVKNIPSETDRGSGNKAKRRAGIPVEKKSPTYKAYVMNKEEFTTLPLRLELPKSSLDFKQGLMFRESLDTDGGMLFVFDNIAQQSFHMTETKIPLDIAFIREDGVIESIKELEPNNPVPVYSEGAIELAIEVNRGWFAENNVEVGDQLDVEYIIPNQKQKYRSETNTIYDIISEVKDKKGKGSGSKDACYHKVKSRYSVWPSAYASGALVKCRKVGAANWGNKSEAYEINVADAKSNTPAYQGYMSGKKNKVTGKPLYKASKDYLDKAKGVKKEETAIESELLIQDWKKDDIKFTEIEAVDIIKPEPLNPSDWRTDLGEMKRDEYGDPVGGPKISKKQKAKNLAANTPDEDHTTTTAEGASYGIFKGDGKPKGAMAGFAKKKPNPFGKRAKLKMIIKGIAEKERSKAGVTSEAMNPAQQAAIAISKKQRMVDLMVASKKKKKEMKEDVEQIDELKLSAKEKEGLNKSVRNAVNTASRKIGLNVDKAKRFDSASYNQRRYEKEEVELDEKCWKGYEKKGMKTMFGKRYPNCVKKKIGESLSDWRKDLDIEEGAAWTKKSGKSPSGGLNEKGRKSYERENPGSDLKAPSKKVGNKRRASFCARMKGMKKKLTSAKTARDPDSRINKSLRAWNC